MDKEELEETTKLREQRATRRQQKKLEKRVQKQKENDLQVGLLRQQPKNTHLSLISKEFVERFANPWSKLEPRNKPAALTDNEFPALGEGSYANSLKTSAVNKREERIEFSETEPKNRKRHGTGKISILDFIGSAGETGKTIESKCSKHLQVYCGNVLDSDLPERKWGKHSEVPKEKRPTHIKAQILDERFNSEVSNEIYVDNVITDQLNETLKLFVTMIVNLQEKLYKRDPIKGFARRRYVLGFRETKKHLALTRVKIVIIAPDLKDYISNGAVDEAVKQIINKANCDQVPYVYGLKRRLIGKLAKKQTPASCIAITNYEGIEEYWHKVVDVVGRVKAEYGDSDGNAMNEVNIPLLANLMEALRS